MTRPAILLTHPAGSRPWWYGEAAMDGLRALGELRLNLGDAELEGEALVAAAQGCRVIVLDRATAVGEAEMAALPQLFAIVRSGVETRHVDIEAASRHGIVVTRTNPGYVASTAELILAHMLNVARDVPEYVAAYRAGSVRAPSHGRELSGATAGLIGYGRIAQHLARILSAIGMEVLAHDPFVTPTEPAVAVPLHTLLARSDFVVPILSATPETRNLLDATALGRVKRGAFLVNASRGDVIDEPALLAALESGHIAGAGLDVGWGPDQTPSALLSGHPRVRATPHIGNLTLEAAARHPAETVAQCAQVLRGEIPFGALNPDILSRLQGHRS
ncbi:MULTISPECIES: NAD(P)-dependent oxidoreductase [unclassified Pelagibacterium]|uniref:NAD(P)-dependent oxidoreductase n=1 Tax=Pelagibacterium TaxID=1082930 RepID=UPI002814B918|nr:NAD(P)-dependent oxidoreductase [Pelagibacterium sp. H642]WMT91950.1 hydroxyacid dehydrogenase [Pelagibacterium sp. H642]